MKLKEQVTCLKSHGREEGRTWSDNRADTQGARKGYLPVPLSSTESLPWAQPWAGHWDSLAK